MRERWEGKRERGDEVEKWRGREGVGVCEGEMERVKGERDGEGR
jgi:hypothetical protein